MKKEIVELRRFMAEEGMDAYFVPSGDFHSSEYVHDYFKGRAFLSNLTGEAGELVVTDEGAYVWTDGRYFLQAETQLAGTEIELMRMAEPGVPTVLEFLVDYGRRHPGFVLGFDGRVVPGCEGKEMADTLASECGASVKVGCDLVDKVWTERPKLIPSKLFTLPLSTTGKTAEEKIADVRAAMADKGADYLLISDLMEVAWLLNLRGNDVACTPVFYSYILLGMNDLKLFVMDGAMTDEAAAAIPMATVLGYDEIGAELEKLGADKKLWLNSGSANYALYEICLKAADGANLIDEMTPLAMMKAVKNHDEIKSTINAHIRDGLAVTKFIKWVKDNAAGGEMTELSACDYLYECRKEQGAMDISFTTIVGYGPNGAIIHYEPDEESNAAVKPEGFMLVDSGGQYIDGTTDITRTIAVGPITQEMKDGYTYVLKSHIAFSKAVVTPDMTGIELDALARKPMREVGLDFKHGISHGVGHLLCVHEGPNILRRVATPIELLPGMVMSNEPGLYIDGEYGIRIENEVVLHEVKGGVGMETITFVPYEREAINVDLLTEDELNWINWYHGMVRGVLEPRIEDEALKAFLIEQTEEL